MSNARAHNHDLKLKRAVQHLEYLEAEIKRWLGGHPYFLVSMFDPKRGEHGVWLTPEGEPPAEFGILIGDCLHNLRSALDSLAYDLAETYQEGPLSQDTAERSEFPIFIEPKKFKDWRKRKIGAIDPLAQTEIERLQPYHGRQSYRSFTSLLARAHPEAYHPLWLLQQLSNIDKHRERHLALFGPHTVEYRRQNANVTLSEPRDATSIRDRTKVFSYQPVDPKAEVDVEFRFALSVAFEEGPPAFGEPVDRVLWRLHTFITHEVLPRLVPYLDPKK